jgi:hypothetical protein
LRLSLRKRVLYIILPTAAAAANQANGLNQSADVTLTWGCRTEGLFAALNDCLYRNMNTFKYLMLIDFDEFIIPHQAEPNPTFVRT